MTKNKATRIFKKLINNYGMKVSVIIDFINGAQFIGEVKPINKWGLWFLRLYTGNCYITSLEYDSVVEKIENIFIID